MASSRDERVLEMAKDFRRVDRKMETARRRFSAGLGKLADYDLVMAEWVDARDALIDAVVSGE